MNDHIYAEVANRKATVLRAGQPWSERDSIAAAIELARQPVTPSGEPSLWIPEADPQTLARLGKLIEELCEGGARAARCIIQGIDGLDPADQRPNRTHLAEELADTAAMSTETVQYFEMNVNGFMDRINAKRGYAGRWFERLAAHERRVPGSPHLGAPFKPKLDGVDGWYSNEGHTDNPPRWVTAEHAVEALLRSNDVIEGSVWAFPWKHDGGKGDVLYYRVRQLDGRIALAPT